MNTDKRTPERPDMKVRLSALWLFAILTYTYGDVVTLMDPVKHGSVQLTEGFLLGGSIFMMIPITMVLLSRILKYKASRWTSIVAGTIMTVALTFTLFVALAGIGTAVTLYPVVKRQNEGVALGFFGSRVLEAATIYAGIVSLLSIV